MTEPPKLVRNFKKAIPLILIGAVFLAFQAIFVKLVSPSVNPNVLVMSRGIVCVISVLFIGLLSLSIKSFGELYRTKHLGKHLPEVSFWDYWCLRVLYCAQDDLSCERDSTSSNDADLRSSCDSGLDEDLNSR